MNINCLFCDEDAGPPLTPELEEIKEQEQEQAFFDEVQSVVKAAVGQDRGTELTGEMVQDELFFTLRASRSWLPDIIVALQS
jgi:hypothetical protein